MNNSETAGPLVVGWRGTALKGVLWIAVLAATFLAIGAIVFLAYALLTALA